MTYATSAALSPRAVSGKWLWLPAPKPHARIRLFCFPNAGSGASAFREWPILLPDDIEVVGLQLPGRENRYGEPMLNRLDDVLQAIWEVIIGMADRPFFFFGHSMGALIAFELTRLLQRKGLPTPFHLVVSGRRAPQMPRRDAPLHLMDDDAFLQKIIEFNGTPKELQQNIESMRLFIPLLRNDFALSENYSCDDFTPITCPLTALGGDADIDVSEIDLAAWSIVAGSHFDYALLPGDHFFIHPSKRRLLERLRSIAVRGALKSERSPTREQLERC